jgi:hypothetical protein
MTSKRKFPKGTITKIAHEFGLSCNTISAVVNGRSTNKKQVEILNRLTEITAEHQEKKKAKELELQQLRNKFKENA